MEEQIEMRILIAILLFFSLAGYSQSVHVDSPKGLVSDLPEVSFPAATDLVIVERNDSSKHVEFGNVYPADHVSMGFTDSAVTLSITEDEWTQITNVYDSLFVMDHIEGMEYVLGDTLKIVTPGSYLICGNIGFKGSNNELWKMAVFRTRDGVATMQGFPSLRYTSVANVVIVPFTCMLVDCLANDLITLEIMNTTDNDDCELNGCTFIVKYFHR